MPLTPLLTGSASTDAIESYLFAALQPLSKANGGPVSLVDRYAGQITATGGVDQAVLQRTPAILLAWDGERGRNDFESLSGNSETEGKETWTVLCVTSDPRDLTKGLKGTPTALGVYPLKDLVLGVLNNLEIPGLIHGERVNYQGSVPVIMNRLGAFVIAVRFTTDRCVEDAPPLDLSVPYAGLTGNLHLRETADAPPDPINTLSTT